MMFMILGANYSDQKKTVGVHPTKRWWKVREVSHKKCSKKVRFQIFLEFAQIDPWQRENQEERFRVAEGFRTQEFGSHGKCVVMELWGGSRHTFCFVALIQRFCVETWIIQFDILYTIICNTWYGRIDNLIFGENITVELYDKVVGNLLTHEELSISSVGSEVHRPAGGLLLPTCCATIPVQRSWFVEWSATAGCHFDVWRCNHNVACVPYQPWINKPSITIYDWPYHPVCNEGCSRRH